MKITRRSMLTGAMHVRDIDCTPEQLEVWRAGTLIQVAMPQLSAADREYLMTGATAEEWLAAFGPAPKQDDVDKIDELDNE